MRPPFVLVAGNIASGKTTMAEALAGALGVPAYLERPEHNPFLSDFYGDATRWGLASQLWFLVDMLEHQREASRGGVQDHSAYENVFVFATVLRERGELAEREYQTLMRLHRLGESSLRAPDAVVLLSAPVEELKRRILARAREYELDVSETYLEQLARTRERYFATWTASPVIPIATDELDPRRGDDLEEIAERVRVAIPAAGRPGASAAEQGPVSPPSVRAEATERGP